MSTTKSFFYCFFLFILLGALAYLFKDSFDFLKGWFFEGILFIGLINMLLYISLALFFKEKFQNGDFHFFQMSVLMLCFLLIPYLVRK